MEGTSRRRLATLFGRVAVPRRRFRCQSCGRHWCPANSLLAPLKGGTITAPLHEAAMQAGSSWPYRVASRLLTNVGGQQRAATQQAEAERMCRQAASQAQTHQSDPPRPARSEKTASAEPPMLVGLDGGWVCSREQRGGMEGKVAVVASHVVSLPMPKVWATFSWSQRGCRHEPKPRHRLVKRRYVATFAPAKELGPLAEAAAHAVREDCRPPVVVLADGADWIKKQQGRHFPDATCILDWAHLWRTIGHAMRVAARAKALSPRQREAKLLRYHSWLWHGQVDLALQGLRRLASEVTEEPRQTVSKAITYLENQREWIGSYEQWKQQGYPVGSGLIERAVALVINRRMKKRGMRWCRRNATAMVALRTDLINDDWKTSQLLRTFP